jgi:Sulfate permease family/EutQ-like cupin domain
VPQQNGLYAAAAGAIIYALFCTSRHMSTGPSSSLAAVAGGAVVVAGPGGDEAVCVMLSRRVALVDDAGQRREFGAGEAFFVPRGAMYTWETIEPSEKIFIRYDGGGAPS